MARNKFEVEYLKLKHFYGSSQDVDDKVVLKKLEDYMNNYLSKSENSIVSSSVFIEGANKVYLFKFQYNVLVNDIVEMLMSIDNQ